MSTKSLLSVFLFLLFIDCISTSEQSTQCYFGQYIKKLVRIDALTEKNCNVTTVTDVKDETVIDECSNDSDKYLSLDYESDLVKFELSIRLGQDTSHGNIRVLNITISRITFYKLRVRLLNLASPKKPSFSQIIEFDKDNIPDKISLFTSVWEKHRTKIEFFAEQDDGNTFYKEYHFTPPESDDILSDKFSTISNNFEMFAYVDTTLRHKIQLRIQPLPESSDVIYDVKFFERISESKQNPVDRSNLTGNNLHYESNVVEKRGSYFFLITQIDKNGGIHELNPVAGFCMEPKQMAMVITIVSYSAIPIVIFFALYIIYILFRKRIIEKFKEKRPVCMIVYSATHDSHIDVVVQLAEYLKKYNINVMLDKLDIKKQIFKNPVHWCDYAFQVSDIVLVVSSPKPDNSIKVTKTIYRDLDKQAYKLIHGGRGHRNKKYLSLLLPYCTEDDINIEARAFKCLEIPKDLKKLVHEICYIYSPVVEKIHNDQELLKCIKFAYESIHSERVLDTTPKNTEVLIELLSPKKKEISADFDQRSETDEASYFFPQKNGSQIDGNQYSTPIWNVDLLQDRKGQELLGNENNDRVDPNRFC